MTCCADTCRNRRRRISLDTEAFTHDYFYRRRIAIFQKRKGYRFSLDAPILADFLPVVSGETVEVGCGCGVISLLGLHRNKFPRVTAVEIQPDLARLAELNAGENGMENRMKVIEGDFRQLYSRFSSVSLVFSNPPFEPLGRGRLSRIEEIRLAKFEVTLTLAVFFHRAAEILAFEGKVCLIFPAFRWNELREEALRAGLHVIQYRQVRAFPAASPDRFLALLSKERGTCVEVPPLTVFRRQGQYSEEMDMIFSGVRHD